MPKAVVTLCCTYNVLSVWFGDSDVNTTVAMNTTTVPPTTTTTPEVKEDLPEKGELEKEKNYSMMIFFILLVVGQCQLP